MEEFAQASSTVPYTKQQAARAANHNYLASAIQELEKYTQYTRDKYQGVCYNKEAQ
ncbi:11855_t:CDS:2 [Entrophospora sp. SA101]|nr:12359_t:CDS:2 [Entrophospora sp. SA101]CAJ0843546.1 11855_t:CDS:2 [Entrophospora sp. SA101]